MQFDIRAMRDGLVDVHVLALAEAWIEIEIDFVAKQIVEINRRQGVIAPESLLEARLHRARLFRLQQWVGESREAASIPKRLGKRRLFDSSCIRADEAGPGEERATFQCQHRERSPGHELVAEAFVVDKAAADNQRKPGERKYLLSENRVIAAQAVADERQIAGNAVLILKLKTSDCLGPRALGINGLVVEASTVVVVDVVELKVFVNGRRRRYVDN